ncbi:uncharacterized protein N7511_010892 [Penicillium nucicola]|uniref:uncharacterized protein n=1 Tax=Penicillium nucicola TaxID=1850975 RepID=UPI0025455FA4|nr:uncharacterized protein N7511_010892 [Penicillium nucicola]KAJ5749196.1 hypothetical protein N7511_010892 [Penicillium nucicola]
MAWSTLLFRGLELLRSPIFHRMVGRIHEKVQHVRHGVPPETKLENEGSSIKQFFDYFKEELKDQAKGNPRNKL